MADDKRYRARDGRFVLVDGRRVGDDPAGVVLRETAAVRDHVRNKRLLLVEQRKPAREARKVKED